MNNALYSNTIENLRDGVDIRLMNNEKGYLKWTSKPSYIAQKIFDKDLVAIHKIKTTLILNKPAYFGMCKLELSKVPVYEFHYDYIKNKYGNKSRLLATWYIKLKLKTFMTILVRIKKCLILVIILLSQSITMIQTH